MTTKIAVFGSSTAEPGSDAYEMAYVVGSLLGRSGFVVMSGGYNGVMEAVSKGAAENGGHVIGVTSSRIKEMRNAEPNAWLAEQIHFETLRDRLLHLVWESDGYIVMHGGFGTLLELVSALEFMHARDLPPRPLVIYRPFWKEFLDPMRQNPHFRRAYWEHVQFADTPEALVSAINLQEKNGR